MAQNSFLDVNSIRPDFLAETVAQAKKKDREWIRQNMQHFAPALCPLCHTAPAQKNADSSINTPAGIAYSRCNTCNTLFINPQPSEQFYKEFYLRSEVMKVFSSHIFPASQEAREKSIYLPRLNRMLEYYKKHSNISGKYVEIGAGSGAFTSLVQKSALFSECIALEPSPSLADSCESKGLKTMRKAIEEVTEPFANTAVMACFEVIEHLKNPAAFLQKACSALPSKGMFFLTTPNGLGFDVTELGANSTTLGITHIQLFNPHSITTLLQQCGFTVLDVCTPGMLDVDLVHKHYAKAEPAKKSWLAHFLLNSSTDMKNNLQNFLVANKQSSHMWAVAIKP